MKYLLLTILASLTLLSSPQVFSADTEFDIHELNGFVTTIGIRSNYSFSEIGQKLLSYRGQPESVINLFKAIVLGEVQSANVDAEINRDTGTIAITVSVSGFLGVEYYYYMLTQADN